jgi:hypothetical protein
MNILLLTNVMYPPRHFYLNVLVSIRHELQARKNPTMSGGRWPCQTLPDHSGNTAEQSTATAAPAKTDA